MNSSKSLRLFGFALPVSLALAVAAQSGPPAPPPDPYLQSYSFPTNWVSDVGNYQPAAASNLVSVSLLGYNTLQLDTGDSQPAFLAEYTVEPSDGHTNADFAQGALECIFVNDWATADTNQGGSGPGDTAYLLATGDFTSGSPQGLWGIWADATGQNLIFGGVSNSQTVIYASMPISWPANAIHLFGLTYDSTNSTMYLDGNAISGGPVTIIPTNNIFYIGSDSEGLEQLQAVFWYLEFDSIDALSEYGPNYFTNDWTSLSNQYAAWVGTQGIHPANPGDDGGVPELPGGGDGGTNLGSGGPGSPLLTNASYSSNQFWLQPLPPGTNAFNTNPNAVTFILWGTTNTASYQLQTMSALTESNWTPQQIFPGANGQNWTPITFSMAGQTTLFFTAIIYSQDTTDGGLPDWWKIAYGLNPNSVSSGTNGVSDAYSDPAGDGWTDLQKFENGMNPNIFYTPPAPQVSVTVLANGNVLISWNSCLGNVTGYFVYRNNSVLSPALPTTQTSYTDTSVSVSAADSLYGTLPSYQVVALYNDPEYSQFSVPQTPTSANMAIDVAVLRGPKGQFYLAAPNIPNTVTNVRVYVESGYSEFPNILFDIYSEPMTNFNSIPSASYMDFPTNAFVNGLAPIPQTFLPYYNSLVVAYVSMGINGTFGPAAYIEPGFYQDAPQSINWYNNQVWSPFESYGNSSDWYNYETSSLYTEINGIWGNVLPFLDGTTQLRQNLIFQLETADQVNPLQFTVWANSSAPSAQSLNFLSDVSFLANYAWANFHTRFAQNNVALVDEFKPFEDNYFYRNFVVQSPNDLNSWYGSLKSGVAYVGGGQSSPTSYPGTEFDVQIPTASANEFPTYAYAVSGNTNAPAPILSTNSQQVFSTWPGYGSIPASYSDDGNYKLTLAGGQYNIFGLPYQSLTEYYSPDGINLYTVSFLAGQTLPDIGASNYYSRGYYPQVGVPQLHTVGYFFGMDDRDYLPGDVGFTPMTGIAAPIIATPGTPLLLGAWAEQSINRNTNTPGFLEQYFNTSYSETILGGQSTNQLGILSEYGEFFPTDPGIAVLVTKTNAEGGQGSLQVPIIGLYVDRNHDGLIDTSFSGPDFCTPNRPFQFWVNDDNDSGDTGGDDVPGKPASEGTTPNGVSGIINGVRDLDDFFPIYVDIIPVLQQMQTNPIYASLQFRLSQADGALSYVETLLTTNDSLQYLTDTNEAYLLSGKPTIQITSNGVYLSQNFLTNVLDGGGIILAEGSTNTANPLVLDVLENGYIIAEAQLPLHITGVEQMFRHVNLTGAVLGATDGPANRLTSADVPNEPDSNGTNFIFVHGYNVNPYQARGSFAELFKRMYWSGSHAKFYGVTWMGYDTQVSVLGSTTTPNYHTNVYHAFQTAPQLAAFLNGLSGPNIVAAHSLGNMVVLSALNDHSASVKAYFMIDAAAAIEAVDAGGANTNMVHPQWNPYDDNIWASYWYQLFSTNDYRSQLNWTGRFANIAAGLVYNFYSSGEEVLRTSPGSPPSVVTAIFDQAVLNGIFNQNPVGSFAWVWQEKMKGRTAGNWILGSNHGGWGFNSFYGNTLIPPNAGTVNSLTSSQLQTNPVFDVSYDGPLLYGSMGSTYAQTYRNRILSDAIPAVSLALGANPVPSFDDNHNLNMQALYENSWPASKSNGTEAFNWYHSDYRAVAYTYTHGLFDQFVAIGNLK